MCAQLHCSFCECAIPEGAICDFCKQGITALRKCANSAEHNALVIETKDGICGRTESFSIGFDYHPFEPFSSVEISLLLAETLMFDCWEKYAYIPTHDDKTLHLYAMSAESIQERLNNIKLSYDE